MNFLEWTNQQWFVFFAVIGVLSLRKYFKGLKLSRKEEKEEKIIQSKVSTIPKEKRKRTKVKTKAKSNSETSLETKQKLYVLKSEQQQKQSTKHSKVNKKTRKPYQQKQKNKITKTSSMIKPDTVEALKLDGITISVIGGNEKYFKDTIEQVGGKLIHYTGHGGYAIPQNLNNIDLVCFYIEQCSHGAVEKVKEMCKKEQVPFCFIRGGRHGLKRTITKNLSRIKNRT